jgi:thioredoxin reductase (NADPH)
MNDLRDITIIGGGPTGLFAAFYAGMRGLSVRIIDSLPELGGQLTALYPEKYIFDVGGFARVLAKDLATEMMEQALQFDPEVVLDEEVRTLRQDDGCFVLEARTGTYRSKTIVVAGGKGAFEPRPLIAAGYEELLGKGVYYAVKDPDEYRGKRVLIVGGGDSALDWALILKDRAERVIVAHRRDAFRAHEKSVQDLMAAHDAGEVEVWTFFEVKEIQGKEHVTGAVLYDNRTQEETHVELDSVLTFLGFKPDLGPIKNWGLDVEKNRILVNQLMETNIPGIYAAGDVVQHEAKLDLIATGFAEAAVAVNNAVHFVDPTARVNPGHSTSMKVFKDS